MTKLDRILIGFMILWLLSINMKLYNLTDGMTKTNDAIKLLANAVKELKNVQPVH